MNRALLGSVFIAAALHAANVSDDFYSAIRANNIAQLQSLVAKDGVNVKDSRGETPLMYAAAVGSPDAMNLLLDKKAGTNAQTEFGATALMWSVTDPAKVRMLVERGANVNLATKRGRTALFLAAYNDRSAEVVRLLLAKGADAKAVPSRCAHPMTSDAFATGQSLYTLAMAGVRASDALFQNGVRFLLKTQAADGSWHVVSRAPKFQIYFESGFPYGGDQWISQWATGWAAMALAQAVEGRTNRAAR